MLARKGTSLVEMLAVMAVIMILLGAYAASSVRTKGFSNDTAVRMYAATIDTAMHKALLLSPTANADWHAVNTATTTPTNDPAVSGFYYDPADPNKISRSAYIYNTVILGYLGNAQMYQIPIATLKVAFNGYFVTFPDNLISPIQVRNSAGILVYPDNATSK